MMASASAQTGTVATIARPRRQHFHVVKLFVATGRTGLKLAVVPVPANVLASALAATLPAHLVGVMLKGQAGTQDAIVSTQLVSAQNVSEPKG